MKAICGFLRLSGAPAHPHELPALRAALVPGDGRNLAAFEGFCEGNLALGAARWSRQEPTAGESQLARHAGTGCVAVVDARMDERSELARELALAPRAAQAELILHAWLRWGDTCVDHLQGDFAFAVWDPRGQRLFCARDGMGVRPLYLHHAPGRLLAFASRAQALLALAEVPRTLDEGRIADSLVSPLESIDKTSTFHQAIQRLPPAHFAEQRDGGFRQQRYWRLQAGRVASLPRSDAQWAEALTEVLDRAVACHLESDVRVGCMLSGGMDSSTLAVIARDQLARDGRGPLPTFSSISDDPGCNETRAIRAMLEQPGFAPTLLDPTAIDAMHEELLAAAWQSDEPWDAPGLLLHAQYAAAARVGVGAVMDGIDADTLLSEGQALVRQIRSLHWLAAWRNARGRQRIYPGIRTWRTLTQGVRSALVPHRLRLALRPGRIRQQATEYAQSSLLAPDFAARIDLEDRVRQLHGWSSLEVPRDVTAQAARSLDHPNTIVGFERYHRIAAWHGVDPRHPFNERRVMELCINLSDTQRVDDGWSKVVLRRAMHGRLPDPVCWRTGKEHLGWSLIERLQLGDPEQVQQRLTDCREVLAPYVDLAKLDAAAERWQQPEQWEARGALVEVLNLGNWLSRQSSLAQPHV